MSTLRPQTRKHVLERPFFFILRPCEAHESSCMSTCMAGVAAWCSRADAHAFHCIAIEVNHLPHGPGPAVLQAQQTPAIPKLLPGPVRVPLPAALFPRPAPPSSPVAPKPGYSFSLAPFQPASATYHSTGASNPFGPHAILGSDTIFEREDALVDASTMSDPGAPTDQSLAPPAGPPRADSRPDFVRGFGLDIPEEEEPPEEEDESGEDFLGDASRRVQLGGDDTMEMEFEAEEGAAGDEETEDETEDERGLSTVAQSRIHSRHVSRLSAALSLLSVGGTGQDSPRHVGHAAD
ncbi:hypothetical protein OF83DRAFT_1189271, partial [Amylostereum chailletii]